MLQEVLAEHGTERLVSTLAQRALTTRDVMGHDDTLPDRELRHTRARRYDFTNELVTKDATDRSGVVRQLEKIGATETTTPQAQQHFSRPDLRDGTRFQSCCATVGTGDNLHGAGEGGSGHGTGDRIESTRNIQSPPAAEWPGNTAFQPVSSLEKRRVSLSQQVRL